MIPFLSTIKENFEDHISSVEQLMNFDRILLEFCISQLEALEERIKSNQVIQITNPYLMPTNTLMMLRTIRKNDSMRKQYEGIFNQCLVLAVSYYTSTLSTLFIETINYAGQYKPALIESSNEDFKITLSELRQLNFNLADNLGELIVKKKDLSFQDMQSVSRCFKNFFNIEIPRDRDLNNIIVSQASRHAIVHALSNADEKFIRQISDANPRSLLTKIKHGETIRYQPDDIYNVMNSMKKNILIIIQEINKRIEK